MRKHRPLFRWIPATILLLLSGGPLLLAAADETPPMAGWEEGTPGRWNSLPEKTAEAAPGVFRAKIALAPGTGVSWEKRIRRELGPEDALNIEMLSTGTNRTSRDYRRFDAHFPLSVTVVFGRDSVDLPWKKRFADLLRSIWHGFAPGGIRLRYAYGNVVPVGSMFRLGEEETIFVLAGEEEQGKSVVQSRNLREDFRAAYGRYPGGPVTRILVSAERPSREDGAIECSLRIESPFLM